MFLFFCISNPKHPQMLGGSLCLPGRWLSLSGVLLGCQPLHPIFPLWSLWGIGTSPLFISSYPRHHIQHSPSTNRATNLLLTWIVFFFLDAKKTETNKTEKQQTRFRMNWTSEGSTDPVGLTDAQLHVLNVAKSVKFAEGPGRVHGSSSRWTAL